MNFDQAFEKLIGHEGGYVDHPADPGGATKYGISRRSYPAEDIPNLTLERAKAIYLRDYWQKSGCDYVPESMRFDLFDMAVNSGVGKAIRTMQDAVGAKADGVVGPNTLMLLDAADPARLRARFNGLRLSFMADLPTWPRFGRGWAKRVAANLLET